MRSSSQKFIARNRAPRVQVEYGVEIYGAEKKITLPFIVGVFADVAGRPKETPPHILARRMKEIDTDNFDDCLREIKPRAAFTIPSSLGGSASLDVDITFESLSDFSPTAVAMKIAGLDTLLEQRSQLANFITYMDGKSGTELVVQQLLKDRQLLSKIALQDQGPVNERKAEFIDHLSVSELESEDLATNSFLESIVQQFKPKTDGARQQVKKALRILAENALPVLDILETDALNAMESLVNRIDRKLTMQINPILHHPEFKQLEGAWRGLHYLVSGTETDEILKIRFMPLSKRELSKIIKMYRGSAWDQSPLFKIIYDAEYGQFGGEPYGCLIGDYEFSNSPEDIVILRGVAQIAAAAHSPFLAAASPATMHMSSWQEIANPRDLSKMFSSKDYAAWQSLRESEDSIYLALAMPRFLARLPYEEDTNPVEEFSFQEDCDVGKADSYIWCNSAYAMALNITRAFKLYGWCVRIRGIESGGIVDDLPAHVFPTDDGGIDMRSPTEISISDRWEAELARNGFMPLVHRQNSEITVFLGAESFHKSAEYDDPDTTANAAYAARLPIVLASCRFAHYLKCIVRDRIGSFQDRTDMEHWLNDWINHYVDQDPVNSSEENKARRPLADAEIVLEEIEGNSSHYNCKFYIRPHYQLLEGLTISLRLLVNLPSEHPA